MKDAVTILELIAWGLDDYAFRPQEIESVRSPDVVERRYESGAGDALEMWRQDLSPMLDRRDLQAEFAGLCWRLGLVDLRTLVAFQRRLRLTSEAALQLPSADDRKGLTALAFGPPRKTTHDRVDALTFVSDNPDLTLRASDTGLRLHGGSPFFEVAAYQGRLFLRDGYHRAYHLLTAQIFWMPAVVIEAQTLIETGAGAPWFFPEQVLLSERPPLLTDFHDPALTVRYSRPHLRKTIRVHVEEMFSAGEVL